MQLANVDGLGYSGATRRCRRRGPCRKKRIYLINPKTPENFWAMQGTLDIVGKHKTLMPNAALLTLAALTPAESTWRTSSATRTWRRRAWTLKCDLVAITGYTCRPSACSSLSDAFPQARACRSRWAVPSRPGARAGAAHGRPPVPGRGRRNLAALSARMDGRPGAPLYQQEEFIDLKNSPAPDLSRIKASDYLYFSVQTCRGCPNNCDFCDVVRLVGRKFRTKTIRKSCAR
jgi:hypothetical protein